MGILTDLVIATDTDLAQVPEDEVPAGVLPAVDIKGIGLIEFATLRDIALGLEFDPGLHAFPFVGEETEEGPWVNRIPDDLVRHLAGLDDAALASVAARWAGTEELDRAGWNPEEAASRLRQIRAFAARALEAGKPIHLWTCL